MKRRAWAEGCRGPYSCVGGSGHDGGGAQPGLLVCSNEFVPSKSFRARFSSAEPRGGARGSVPAGRRWRRRGQRAAGPGRGSRRHRRDKAAPWRRQAPRTAPAAPRPRPVVTGTPHRALLLPSQVAQGTRECGFVRFSPNPVCAPANRPASNGRSNVRVKQEASRYPVIFTAVALGGTARIRAPLR